MKITIETLVTVERSDGTYAGLKRTHKTTTGDNPAFERAEVARALTEADAEFRRALVLNGDQPL